MVRLTTSILLVGFLCSPAFASNPGEPLDCSDWVFLEPGLSCAKIDCDLIDTGWCRFGNDTQPANEGGMLRVRVAPLNPPIECQAIGATVIAGKRLELLRFDGTTETILGFLDERCQPQSDATATYVRF